MDEDSDEEIPAPKLPTGMETPHTTAKTLKENVVVAKNLEESGKFKDALYIYEKSTNDVGIFLLLVLPVMKSLKYVNQISKVEKRIEVLRKKLNGVKLEKSNSSSGLTAVKFSLYDDQDNEDEEYSPPNRSSDQRKRDSSSSNKSESEDFDPK